MTYVILGALTIGLTLGLMGSGGSILTVPVLVYALGHDGKVAIAESLAIVGSIALATMIPYARSHMVDWRLVLFFGLPGMAGTYFGAWLAHFVPGAVQLTLFALVMLGAAVMMIRRQQTPAGQGGSASDTKPAESPAVGTATAKPEAAPRVFWVVGLQGMTVGILTGLVGVGGGFLIVPALVVLGKLPMRAAVGTSLTVIALNSFSGFFKYLDVLGTLGMSVDWPTVGAFIGIGIVGSLAGHQLAMRINQQLLQRGFAAFLIVMGLFVLGKESPKLLASPTAATHVAATHAAAALAPAASHAPVDVPPALHSNPEHSNPDRKQNP